VIEFVLNKYLYKGFLLIFLACSFPVFQAEAKEPFNKADSILSKVFIGQGFYGKFINEFDADIYIKGNSTVKKKNILYRYAPDFLYMDKKGKNTFVEMLLKVHFKQPNFFSNQIVAVNGAKINIMEIQERVIQLLNHNAYNPKIVAGQILLPWTRGADRYYRYEYISQTDTLNRIVHHIKVTPKVRSLQLVSGTFSVMDGTWIISRYALKGKWEFSKFEISTEFGFTGSLFLMPLKTDVYFHTKLLGNETDSHYSVRFGYNSVKKMGWEQEPEIITYDLSDNFKPSFDSIPFVEDEKFWEENRKISLTPEEKNRLFGTDSTGAVSQKDSTSLFWKKIINIPKGIVTPSRFVYNDSKMSYSGLLNPLKLGYSKWDGLVYWQQFRLFKRYEKGQEIRFEPNLGYLFRRKQVYFNTPVNWLFQPHKFGEINFNFGNRNQTFNSKFVDLITQEIPDSIRFEDLNLDYFRHFKMNLEGKYEVSNGLILRGGAYYDWYIPIKKEPDTKSALRSTLNINEDVENLIEHNYKIFSPLVGLIWTPRQYYRFDGKRKEYLGSRFPTVSLEYVWGVNKFLGSNGNYSKVEADIQQKIPTGLMRSFQYYIGMGRFLNARSVYFANFDYFQRHNFPQSWDDPIGGVFHLLANEWYDASNSYIQAHIMYEFPSTFLRWFRGVSKDILKERFYVSQLYTPALPSYTEIGYGVGNFIGNAGVFVSFKRWEYKSIGVKFAFELGK